MEKLTREEVQEVWENLEYKDFTNMMYAFGDAVQDAYYLKNNPAPTPKTGCWVDDCEGDDCVLNQNNKHGYIPMDCSIAVDKEYSHQEQCIFWTTK